MTKREHGVRKVMRSQVATNNTLAQSNDVGDIFNRLLRPPNTEVANFLLPSESGFIENEREIIKAMKELDNEIPCPMEDTASQTNIRTKMIHKTLDLTRNVKYRYVMAEAYIVDTGRENKRIWVDVINSKGQTQRLCSFARRSRLSHHHEKTFDYLSARKEQRGLFAICVSSRYRGLLAESVTSIALQLMRNS